MNKLTHLSLFAGIGGIDLAAEWAGFQTIAFCEIDPYCQKVLKKHWPDVPIIGDIRDVTKEKVMADTRCEYEAEYEQQATGAGESSQVTANANSGRGNGYKPSPDINRFCEKQQITLLTGGFPCQPFSQAGKRKGSRDDRYLWHEMLRVIREVKPAWVVGENVGGITNLEVGDSVSDLEGEVPEEVFEHNTVVLDRVCTDLEEIGYSVQPFLIPACAVNAPHRRDRVFIVGYSAGKGLSDGRGSSVEYNGTQSEFERPSSKQTRLQDVTNSQCLRGETGLAGQNKGKEGKSGEPLNCNNQARGWQGTDQWAVEPDVGRVANGVPSRVDRLKCLGNAVVPQQIYPILKAIADIENNGAN